MISNKQRRGAVDELRCAAAGEYRHVDALDVIAGAVGVSISGKYMHDAEETVYGALADLIDRPVTCNIAEYPGFKCKLCGDEWPLDIGLDYCPRCGAEVVERC